MANQITDGRTLVSAADTATNWTNATQDTEIFIQGTASNSTVITNTLKDVVFDTGAAQNWSNNTFYIWVNCGVVGRLLTKAAGGMRIRFAGPTATNFFEVYVAGSDSWPNSVAGGWTMFVVSIEDARAGAIANGWTGGTPPATSAIQRVGIAAQTSAMTRNVANTWVDAIWRLPQNTPGIIVEGRNGGTTPWTFSNIATQLGEANGSFRLGAGGSWVINTPLQIGINDTTIHSFSDTNQLVLWDNQEYASTSLYGIRALGNAGGTTSVVFGAKTGTGDDATGAQGITMQAAATGVRFYVDFNDPNLNTVGLYGCTFIHASTLSLDLPIVESVSTQYIDCSRADVADGLQLRASVIDADTADGVAFMFTNDMSDIKFSSFQFSDGHAIQLTTPITATQNSTGNVFSGYGATGTNDAAIYNNAAGAVTINAVSGSNVSTYRNGAGASTVINNPISFTVTNVLIDSEVRILTQAGLTELGGVENVSGSPTGVSNVSVSSDPNNAGRYRVTYNYNYVGDELIYVVVFNTRYQPLYLPATLQSTNTTLSVFQIFDRQYDAGSIP